MSAPASNSPATAADASARVGPTIAGFALTRLVGNLFVRFPSVFITQIARGLGVEVTTLTWVFGARELGGLVAPKVGKWVDGGHTARVIAVAGGVAGLSCLAAATSWFGLFVVVMVVGGAAKISVDLAENAWVGHNVPLENRGRIIGLIEMTWAGAFLIGIPALAWAVEQWGWKAAFAGTGPLVALAAIVSGARLPPDPAAVLPPALSPPVLPPALSGSGVTKGPVRAESNAETGVSGSASRVKTAVWIFCFLQPLAQMLIFAVNGDWFVKELDLSTTALGVVTALLGVAELIGTGIAMAITDRFGPLRCGMWGILATAVPLFAVVGVGTSVVPAVTLLVLMDIAIEFAFVAVLPMVSELDVDNRGQAVSHVFVLIMVARAIASGLAGVIYSAGGFHATVVAAGLACIVAAGALSWARRA